MARRGAMTAIQAALAGLSGGAAGYVRQREMQKEQDRLKKQEERQQRMDIMDLLERGGVTQAAPGESITGPVPSAVPMVAPERGAMAAALQAAGPRTGAGSEMFNIGGTSILMPSKAQRDLQASQRALDAAIQQAEATGAVRMRQEREAFDIGNRRQFEVYRQQYQGRGEYNPNLDYASLNSAKEAQLGRASAQQIAQTRADATASGAAGAAGGRGPLPSVQDAIDYVNNLTADDVKKLSGWGVANAIAAPTTMASGAQGFLGAALGPLVSGAQYAAASEADRQYAEYASMVARQVARLNEKGVLSNQDVKDYKDQTGFVAGETESGKARKIARLKQWAEWVRGTETGTDDVDTAGALRRLPGESPQAYLVRTANLRRQ